MRTFKVYCQQLSCVGFSRVNCGHRVVCYTASTCLSSSWKSVVPFDHPPLPHVEVPNLISFSMSLSLFLKYNWPTILSEFLVHNIVMQYFCTFQKDHYNSSYSMSPNKAVTVTDCIPHTVHFVPMTHLLCNWKFTPPNFPHLFLSSPTTVPSGNHLFVLSIYNSVSVLLCLFAFKILHGSETIQYLSFSIWLI